jgi:hypothetical protein
MNGGDDRPGPLRHGAHDAPPRDAGRLTHECTSPLWPLRQRFDPRPGAVSGCHPASHGRPHRGHGNRNSRRVRALSSVRASQRVVVWRGGAVLRSDQHYIFDRLLTRGFDVFGTDFVRTGAFDRVLLRPRSVTLQLIGYEIRLSRIGRMLQGLAALVLATRLAHIDWDPAAVAIAVWAVAGGVALFAGILVLQATLSFWTIESLEAVNVFTYGSMPAGFDASSPSACRWPASPIIRYSPS